MDFFFYLFKYLATFGSASPACTKGTTLEQEKGGFSAFHFPVRKEQINAICWSTKLHTPTSRGAPVLIPHGSCERCSVPPGEIPGGHVTQIITITFWRPAGVLHQRILVSGFH